MRLHFTTLFLVGTLGSAEAFASPIFSSYLSAWHGRRQEQRLERAHPRRSTAAAAGVRGGAYFYMSSADPLAMDPVLTQQQEQNAARNKLVLQHIEEFMPKLAVVTTPLCRITKLLFGVSILFYGMQFRTVALHVIIFRISGYKDMCKVRVVGNGMALSRKVGACNHHVSYALSSATLAYKTHTSKSPVPTLLLNLAAAIDAMICGHAASAVSTSRALRTQQSWASSHQFRRELRLAAHQ